jgi:hypothetical protein
VPATMLAPATVVINKVNGERPASAGRSPSERSAVMADQRSRGGKKEATGKQPHAQQQQNVKSSEERPAEGQPGGPKQKSKSGRDHK